MENKKNRVFYYVIIGLLVLIIMLCTIYLIKPNNNLETKDTTRTVIVYMVGSDLESRMGLGTTDLSGVDYKNLKNNNVNLVIMAGGSKVWHNNYISKDETSIYELTSSGYVKIKTQEIQNMGEPKILSNFLNYVYDNYKSDKYDLILWNHGEAIMGSEVDDLSDDLLTMSEMKEALANSPFNNQNKLETLFFRTCLNGSIEIANVFKNYAEYMVASEEVTWGLKDLNGSTSALKFLNNVQKSDDGYDLGFKFINNYRNVLNSNSAFYQTYSTYSIINLNNIDSLIEKINTFFKTLNINDNYELISKVRSNLYQYAYTSSNEPNFDMVDLYNLIDGLSDNNKEKADEFKDIFNKTVLYNWATNNTSKGLSVYFPYNGEDKYVKAFFNIYKNIKELSDYNSFINNYYEKLISAEKSYKFTSFGKNISQTSFDNDSYDFKLTLSDEEMKGFSRAEYVVFKTNGDGYYLPVYRGKNVTLKGNELLASLKGRQMKITSDDDQNNFNIALIEELEDDNTITYSSVVALEVVKRDEDFKIDSAKAIITKNKKNGKSSFDSYILLSSSDKKIVPNNMVIDINDYTHIIFASSRYKITDDKGNFTMDWESNKIYAGGEFEISDNWKLVEDNFDDGEDYYAVFYLYDVNNKQHYSNLIKIESR